MSDCLLGHLDLQLIFSRDVNRRLARVACVVRTACLEFSRLIQQQVPVRPADHSVVDVANNVVHLPLGLLPRRPFGAMEVIDAGACFCCQNRFGKAFLSGLQLVYIVEKVT